MARSHHTTSVWLREPLHMTDARHYIWRQHMCWPLSSIAFTVGSGAQKATARFKQVEDPLPTQQLGRCVGGAACPYCYCFCCCGFCCYYSSVGPDISGSRRLFETPADVAALIPCDLAAPFSTADLAAAIAKPRWLARQMAYCLRKMSVIQPVGKNGSAVLYARSG